MSCPACGCESIRTAITQEGKTRVCAKCDALLDEQPAPREVVEAIGESPSFAPRSKTIRKRTATDPDHRLTARGVIASAKVEARRLRASIRSHERAVAAERKQLAALTRLLDAADARPRAVVRPIRTTA